MGRMISVTREAHFARKYIRNVGCCGVLLVKSLALFYAPKVPEILFIKPATVAYWRY